MQEEIELLLYGYPLEDAITMCNSLRRTGELSEFMRQTCGGRENNENSGKEIR